jgi:hypothetical protein
VGEFRDRVPDVDDIVGFLRIGMTSRVLSRRVAQDLADRLNGALNRTVSDSRLSLRPIVGYPGAFATPRRAF